MESSFEKNPKLRDLLSEYVASNPCQLIKSYNRVWCEAQGVWASLQKNHVLKCVSRDDDDELIDEDYGIIRGLFKTESHEVLLLQQLKFIDDIEESMV